MAKISRTGRCLGRACLAWLTLCSAALGTQQPPPAWQQVTLGWNASSDPTVAGYYLYYGTASGVYTNKIDVGTNTMFTVSNLISGSTNYFTSTSYNSARVESSYVPAVSYIAPGFLGVAQNRTNGMMCVQFPVAPGQFYQLQASSDLVSWSDLWLTPVQSTNTWVEYDEPCTNTVSGRFYRLVLY
jgi:hypothetical protein